MAVISIRSARPAAHDHSEADQTPVVSAGIASSAVIEGKIGSAAVTSAAIASSAVTATKVVDTLRTHLYIGDETETTSTSTTDEKIKTFTLINDPDYGFNLSKLKWQIENKNSDVSGTTTYTILIDTTSTVGSGTVDGTDYILSTGSTEVSLTTGTHPVDLFLKTSTGGTAYTRLFEMYGNVG